MDMAKDRQSADVGDFFARKADVFEEVESLFEACGNEVFAMGWQMPDKELKGGAGVKAILDVAGRHREFVEVGEEARK
jgi:hypothetical protein